MKNSQKQDLALTWIDIMEEYSIFLDGDLIIGDELNNYFNYKYNKDKDELTVNFEVNEGSAYFKVFNASSISKSKVSFNKIALLHQQQSS